MAKNGTGVMWFETSDGQYWAKLPAEAVWFPIMAQIVALACRSYRTCDVARGAAV